MLKKTFKSSLYLVPIMAVLILFSTHLWNPDWLIAPLPYSGFVFQLESTFAVLAIMLYSFLITNRFEIELGLVNGYSTLKLAISKALPRFLFALFVVFASIGLYHNKPFDIESGHKIVTSIFIPDNYKLYLLFSSFVTVTFFSSLCFFMRILMRNCYLPVISDLLIVSIFFNINNLIRQGIYSIRMCLIDPFISSYFIGDTIPNEYVIANPELSSLKNAWTINRLIFLILSAVFLAAAVFFLRREKLHRGIVE